MIDGNLILDHAEELIRRVSPEGRARARRIRERKRRAARRLMARFFLAAIAVAAATGAFGLIVAPVSSAGFLIALVAFALACALIVRVSREREPDVEATAAVALPLLPQRTEAWLERQRPALPPPAARLLDSIGVRLDALAPQLTDLDPRSVAAASVRKLLCEELPELVKGYRRVPEPLRRQGGDGGASPDRQLLDGLAIIDGEIARMTGQLASGDLHLLATRNLYLELKYKSGDGFGDGA